MSVSSSHPLSPMSLLGRDPLTRTRSVSPTDILRDADAAVRSRSAPPPHVICADDIVDPSLHHQTPVAFQLFVPIEPPIVHPNSTGLTDAISPTSSGSLAGLIGPTSPVSLPDRMPGDYRPLIDETIGAHTIARPVILHKRRVQTPYHALMEIPAHLPAQSPANTDPITGTLLPERVLPTPVCQSHRPLPSPADAQ